MSDLSVFQSTNPHLPRGRSHGRQILVEDLVVISIHTSRAGGVRSAEVFLRATIGFQSTPLAREESGCARRERDVRVISIHSSRSGGVGAGDRRARYLQISIHSSRTGGVGMPGRRRSNRSNFNPLLPRGRSSSRFVLQMLQNIVRSRFALFHKRRKAKIAKRTTPAFIRRLHFRSMNRACISENDLLTVSRSSSVTATYSRLRV